MRERTTCPRGPSKGERRLKKETKRSADDRPQKQERGQFIEGETTKVRAFAPLRMRGKMTYGGTADTKKIPSKPARGPLCRNGPPMVDC